jgi:hypothetical protein
MHQSAGKPNASDPKNISALKTMEINCTTLQQHQMPHKQRESDSIGYCIIVRALGSRQANSVADSSAAKGRILQSAPQNKPCQMSWRALEAVPAKVLEPSQSSDISAGAAFDHQLFDLVSRQGPGDPAKACNGLRRRRVPRINCV